ncbi:hypothetical protein ACWCPQ_14500 [Nocardia sp. NPDC001965]
MAAMDGEEAMTPYEILRAADLSGISLRTEDIIEHDGELTIDGMPAEEWLAAMTMD